MRTTVLIPLHRSSRYVEAVAGNVARLAGLARVVVSDATELDDSLAQLRARVTAPGVCWLGARPITPGWVAHCNDLQSRVTTPYTMWLPHDDEIGPEWIVESEARLEERPDAIGACGSIREIDPIAGNDLPAQAFLAEAFSAPEVGERRAAARDFVEAGDLARLGLLFRAVVRAERAPRLPIALPRDEWADVLWGAELLSRGPVAGIDAVYGKRLRPDSAHAAWPAFDDSHTARGLLADILND